MARQYTTHDKFTRISNAVAAGTTDVECTAIDMQGFESVVFGIMVGAITANAVTGAHVQQSSDNGVADAFSDLAGTAVSIADDDDNGMVLVEVVKPQKRYVKLIIDRATQNAVVDGAFALQYNGRKEPVTQPVSIVATGVTYSPEEGTP